VRYEDKNQPKWTSLQLSTRAISVPKFEEEARQMIRANKYGKPKWMKSERFLDLDKSVETNVYTVAGPTEKCVIYVSD